MRIPICIGIAVGLLLAAGGIALTMAFPPSPLVK